MGEKCVRRGAAPPQQPERAMHVGTSQKYARREMRSIWARRGKQLHSWAAQAALRRRTASAGLTAATQGGATAQGGAAHTGRWSAVRQQAQPRSSNAGVSTSTGRNKGTTARRQRGAAQRTRDTLVDGEQVARLWPLWVVPLQAVKRVRLGALQDG